VIKIDKLVETETNKKSMDTKENKLHTKPHRYNKMIGVSFEKQTLFAATVNIIILCGLAIRTGIVMTHHRMNLSIVTFGTFLDHMMIPLVFCMFLTAYLLCIKGIRTGNRKFFIPVAFLIPFKIAGVVLFIWNVFYRAIECSSIITSLECDIYSGMGIVWAVLNAYSLYPITKLYQQFGKEDLPQWRSQRLPKDLRFTKPIVKEWKRLDSIDSEQSSIDLERSKDNIVLIIN